MTLRAVGSTAAVVKSTMVTDCGAFSLTQLQTLLATSACLSESSKRCPSASIGYFVIEFGIVDSPRRLNIAMPTLLAVPMVLLASITPVPVVEAQPPKAMAEPITAAALLRRLLARRLDGMIAAKKENC
jgi:hypothetical protein